MIIAVIIISIKILLFILEAIGIFKLSKKEEIRFSGLSFVPFLTPYYFGAVSDKLAQKEGKNEKMKVWLLVTFLVSTFFVAAFIAVAVFAANDVVENAKLCIANDTRMTIEMFSSVMYTIAIYFITLFVSLAYKILKLMAFGKIVSKKAKKTSVLYIILSAVLYPLMPIFILINS